MKGVEAPAGDVPIQFSEGKGERKAMPVGQCFGTKDKAFLEEIERAVNGEEKSERRGKKNEKQSF